MKKKLIRLFSLALCLILLAGLAPVNAFAANRIGQTLQITHVNELYVDVLDESDLLRPANVQTAANTALCTTIEEAGAQAREQMKAREETVTVRLNMDYTSSLAYDVIDAALVHTGQPTEGDYLARQYGGWRCSVSISDCVTLSYTMTYYTTPDQENAMDAAVAALLTELDLGNAGAYEKICGIYDYICSNVTYDYGSSSGKLKYTAYAALVNGTAVCQGYATLFYRLALELDVDARIITGDTNGDGKMDHAWNIVRIGDLYYNVDSTWDASWWAAGLDYAFFLKCDENFSDHVRLGAYATEDFYAAYPMGETDYEPFQLNIIVQPISVTAAAGEYATVTVEVQGDGLTYEWYYSDNGGTKFYKTSAFTGNTYKVAMTSARNGRMLYCVITDQYGNSVTTDTVTISMRTALSIVTQPKSVTVSNGEYATVTVEAQGDGLTYEWYYSDNGGTKFYKTSAFTGTTYKVQMTSARNGRMIYCVITDQYGNSVATDTVTIRMGTTLSIVTQPKSVTVASGEYAAVTVKAQGDGLTYEWYYSDNGGTKFYKTSAFTGNTYKVAMTAARNGRLLYCVITDQYGNSVTTDVVTIGMTN